MNARTFAPLLLLAVIYAGAGHAADAGDRPSVPPPPAPPENYTPPSLPGEPSEELEPEVTITTRGTEIHEEYRINGQLYMVKVTPAKGPPYYLIYDERGNARRSDLEPEVIVPSWVIKRF